MILIDNTYPNFRGFHQGKNQIREGTKIHSKNSNYLLRVFRQDQQINSDYKAVELAI